jgi:hypothetical protein
VVNYQEESYINTKYLAIYNQNHYSNLLKNLDKFDIRHIILVIVTKNPLINSIKTQIIKGEHYNSVIKIYIIPINMFFTIQNINRFICKPVVYIEKETKEKYYTQASKQNTITDEIEPGFIIFKFENTNFIELYSKFLKLNINITGGSRSKRHVVTELVGKLILFITALEGTNNVFKKLNESFNIDKYITIALIDLIIKINLKNI